MYTYPQALNAMQRVATDMLRRAHPDVTFEVRVAADAITGTASVDWSATPSRNRGYIYVTINMPVRHATYLMTETEFDHWAAYMLHEIGHPLWTDKQVWREAVATRRHHLLNSLEDVREEKATIDLGIAINARKAFSALISTLQAKAISKGYNPNDLGSIGWTLSYMGRHANGYDLDMDWMRKRLQPKGAVAKIAAWALPELALCQSTKECLDLADKVTAAVKAANKAKAPPPPAPKPEPSREVEAESETVYADEDQFADEPEADEVEPEADEAEADEAEGVADRDESAPQGGKMEDRGDEIETEQEPDAQEPGEGGEDAGTPGAEPVEEIDTTDADDLFEKTDLKPTTNGDMQSTDGDRYTQRRLTEALRKAEDLKSIRQKPIYGRNVNGSVDLVVGSASKMGRQRALLARALKCEETDDYEGGRLHGRLDRRAMARLTTGNPHVFGRRVLAEGYDTDVVVLVDGSGSMAGQRILAAGALALVIAQAAAQVGVGCTVYEFNQGNGLNVVTAGKDKPVKHRFAWMYNQADGCTPLTESMIQAAALQVARASAKRKVMFVITDGGCDLGPEAVHAAGEYIERRMGIEIANLHIGTTVMGLFRNECAVNVNKVTEVGLQRLVMVLEAGAQK